MLKQNYPNTCNPEISEKNKKAEAYQAVLQVSKSVSDRTVFVGDGGSNELLGAKNSGISTIMTTEIVGKLYPDLIPNRLPDADYVVKSLNELL